jgi:hypothetical protein
MSFTDFLELEVLDQLFGALDYAEPATVYLALSTTTPVDDGTNFTEPSGNNYSRPSFTNDKTTWTTAAAGALANAIEMAFPAATGPWGVCTYFGIYDAITGGNLLAYGLLGTAKDIDDGDTAKFAVGDLDITLD